MLDQWLAMNNRTHANPVERLCYQGKRCMGALEFALAQNRGFDETSVIEVASLVKVASDVLHDRAILQYPIPIEIIDHIQSTHQYI